MSNPLDPAFTPGELRVMRVFWASDKPLSQDDLCRLTGFSKGRVNSIVPDLCERGALRETTGVRGKRGVSGYFVAERLRVLVNTLPWDWRLREALEKTVSKTGVAA